MQCTALTNDQINAIHEASLTILGRTGVHVPHPGILDRFADAGARVDHDTQRVYITGELVDRSLASAGKSFTLYGRDPDQQAQFGVGKRNYNSIAGEAYWVDEIGSQRLFPTIADVATAARFGDALDQLTIVGAMTDPHEMPVASRCVEVAAMMLKNTSKPIHFWYHDRPSAKYLNELMVAVRGNKEAAQAQPLWYPFLEPISPLRFPFHGIDLLYETAELNLPVPIGPMAQMGVSAPMSLAGTMAVENAEILAGVCITQLIREGLPVCYGGICHAFDMRTTQMIFCGPEQAIFGVALTQMGKHYGLPVYINVGLTDSKRPDAQAGLEIGVTLAMGAAAGADIFGHLGICGVDQATSLDMLVLQHEIIGYVERAVREVDVSAEALAVDLVDEVVRNEGSFLDTEHTVRRMRPELWMPEVLDREYYQGWLDAGAKSSEQRCRQRREEILATHQPEPITENLAKAIDEVVAAARKELNEPA